MLGKKWIPLFSLFLLLALPVSAENPTQPSAATVPAADTVPAALDTAALDTWPQWRGPQRDGHVGSGSWPSDLQSLQESWRVELDKGYPGPIVGKDRVFVAETADGKTEIVRALDRATGKELWRREWPGEGNVPFFAAANGDWIRATPAYDGETLYVGGMNEVLVALDGATGEQRWALDIPARFGTKVPDFGFSSSPLIDGDHIFVQGANSLLKLDKATGDIIWRSLNSDGDIFVSGAFSSPIIAEIAGKRQLLVQTRIHINGVDLESGDVLWSHDVPSFRGMNILTPVVYGDAIFTSTYRNRSYFYEIEKAGDEFAVKETWTNKVQAYMSSPVVVGDYAYMHLGNGRISCVDLRNGDVRWTSEERFGKYWSKVAQGDKILALDEKGELVLMRANPDRFDMLAKMEVSDQEAWAHLAVAGSDVYVRDLKGITAYRWGTPAKPQVTAEVAATPGQAVAMQASTTGGEKE